MHAYCCKWRLKANVSKNTVMVFARETVEGGERFTCLKYTYLGIDFRAHIKCEESFFTLLLITGLLLMVMPERISRHNLLWEFTHCFVARD